MTVYSSFDPTSLFAGDRQHLHRVITLAGNQTSLVVAGSKILERGTVLGRAPIGEATSAVKASGANTGTGTLTVDTTTPVLTGATEGLYTVRFTSATAFTVTSPAGATVGTGVAGTAFATQIKFVAATGGTAYVAGDGFDVTVEATGDSYVISKKTATDGSQVPVAVLAYDVDTSNGDIQVPAYFEGEFAAEIAHFDTSWTIQTLQTATRQNNIPLFFRSVGLVP